MEPTFLLKRKIILQTFNLWVQNVKFQVRIPFFYVDVLSQTPQQSTIEGKKRCWSQGASSKQPPSAASINMYLGSVKSGDVALVGTLPRDLSRISKIIPESKNLVKVMGWKKETVLKQNKVSKW